MKRLPYIYISEEHRKIERLVEDEITQRRRLRCCRNRKEILKELEGEGSSSVWKELVGCSLK